MITAVLFDLGGVLLRFEPERIVENFGRAVGMTPEEIRDIAIGHLKAEFETGALSPAGFRDAISMALNCALDEAEFVPLWSDAFEPNEPILEFFREVKKTRRAYVVSNTDPYHMRWILDRWPEVAECDGMALSYELGLRKPDPAFFEAAIERFNLTPTQCVLIDDLPENVEAGREVGFHAVLYESAEHVLAQVKPLLQK